MTMSTLRSMLLGGAVGVAMVASAGTANALDYKLGGVDLVVDTTVAVGVTARTEQASCGKIGLENGGCRTVRGTNSGINTDDGDLNYDQWDLTNASVKVTTDFEARYKNFGAFARVKAFYDQIGWEESVDKPRSSVDSLRKQVAREAGGRGISFLDAFVYGNFTVAGDLPLMIRVGRQVNNWGESLFIGGGINSNLGYDVTALRTPGAELKDGVLPEMSAYVSLGLPANFNVDVYYTFENTPSKLDACGSFFATSDYVHAGCAYLRLGADFGTAGGVTIPRDLNGNAQDGGEYGLKIGYYADWLNEGTDIGLYYTNFHSRAPIYQFRAPTPATFGAVTYGQLCDNVNAGAQTSAECFGDPTVVATTIGAMASTLRYRNDYVEDIRMMGLSFNTSIPILGGTALAGEIAYSPNMAFQLDSTEMLGTTLDQIGFYEAYVSFQGNLAGLASTLPTTLSATPTKLTIGMDDNVAGEYIQSHRRMKTITGQLQTTSTLSASDPVTAALGADLLILLSNVGFQYLPDVTQESHLTASASSQIHDNSLIDGYLGSKTGGTVGPAKYATRTSWGYRLVAVAQYNNAMGTPWTVSPSIQWRHDVSGLSAGPIGPGFVEDTKVISLAVTADLQNVYKVKASWTSSFGNEYRNFTADKDFASISFSYAF